MTEVPKNTRAMLLVEFNKPLQIRDLPIPKVEPEGILVRNEMAGICGTDVHQFHGQTANPPRFPILLGHETVGRIVELGEDRTHDSAKQLIKVGDRIIWSHVFCGCCYWCNIFNQRHLCVNVVQTGWRCAEDYPYLFGGYSEYAYLPPQTEVVRVPETLANEEVVGVPCALRTAVASYESQGGYKPEETVVIQGAGPLALYSLVLAREGGAGKIILVGAPENRLSLAREWGADETINIEKLDAATRKKELIEMTSGIGADTVVEASGGSSAFSEGIELVRRGGRYLVIGQTNLRAIDTFRPAMITDRVINVIGYSRATISHYYTALQIVLHKRNKYDFARLVSGKYRLDQVNEALSNMESGKEIKPVLIP